VAGMTEADGELRYNTSVLLGPDGRLLGKYRKHVLEHELVRNTIRELLLGYEEEITELLYESREIREAALEPGRTSDERARALIEYHTKLRNIMTKVDQIMEKAQRMGRPLDRVNSVRGEIEQLQKEMLEQF